MTPNNAWGRRLLNSFAQELEGTGGQLLHYSFYDPNSPDFSNSIQRLLLIDESRARRERLTANLGVQLEYEPRRRADIDLIFVAANATTAKLIRPQLRFYYAGAIPTYATSSIYQPGSRNNSDLNGIMFPDVPWIIAPDGQTIDIRDTLGEFWPAQVQRRSRLYAMGFDAYQLLPMLNNPVSVNSGSTSSGNPRAELRGMTGDLYIDSGNRILRRMPWAKMQRGQPILMEPVTIGGNLPEFTGPIAPSANQAIDPTGGLWPDTTIPADSPNN
jgi:outer membrane PBP1 activator LpoA protein